MATSFLSSPSPDADLPDKNGRYGDFGGRFVPETLVAALDQLEDEYNKAKADPEFQQQLDLLLKDFVGRSSPLYFAKRLTEKCGGAQIWFKREDLNHTGAHKINSTLGQALLTMRMGKTRVIAETGAGQHGVATATACAHFGLPCIVYMGEEDVRRQSPNVQSMKMMGAEIRPVTTGSRTLRDAVNEAMRDWMSSVKDTHYILGSVVGPHPFPMIVRDYQSVIGRETIQQSQERFGRLPDAVVACVGGGSNAIGLFHPFIDDEDVQIYGVEAAGDGLESGRHAAPLSAGKPGVLHGNRTYLMEDSNGQIIETHSVSAGLDYPGVGPEHAWLKDIGRANYVAVTDTQALEGFHALTRKEGIIPALESSHAVAYAMQLAPTMDKTETILINLSGRGDKDINTIAEIEGIEL